MCIYRCRYWGVRVHAAIVPAGVGELDGAFSRLVNSKLIMGMMIVLGLAVPSLSLAN